MDQNQSELTFDESIKQVLQTLPPSIRVYITQERYTAVAKNLMSKYNLRIDQGGVLEREILLLLMGIEDPNEFIQTLVEADFNQQTINGIMQDINALIFTPLQEQMRSGGGNAMPPTQPVRPAIPPPRPQVPMQPRPVNAPVPNYAPQRPRISPTPNDEKLLEDHEEPHIDIKRGSLSDALRSAGVLQPGARFERAPASAPAAVSAGGLRLAQTPQPASPAKPPVAPQPASATTPAPPSQPVPPPAPRAPSTPLPISRYSTDPYREPIDENS